MAYANLNRGTQSIDGFDSIIIVKDVSDIPAGVALNVTDFAENVIKGGHLLIKAANGDVKPLAIEGGAYVALPEGCEYFGINKTTILKSLPMAAVLRAGVVNAAAAKAEIAEYPAAAKVALKNIDFIY